MLILLDCDRTLETGNSPGPVKLADNNGQVPPLLRAG
jgi:hypothetical protein